MDSIKTAYEQGKKAATDYATITDAVYGGAFDGAMDPVESIAWTMGFEGRELVEVTGWRYGDIPESGRSVNYIDHSYERGVSLMALDGDDMVPAVASIVASNRPVVRVRGYLSGYGYDGEPLVIGAVKID